MNGEKSITEKLTDAISKAADSVKSVASTLVDKASNAAQHAMETNAEKLARIPAAKTDPAQVAGTSNEQVTIPEASDAAAMPMPLFPVASAPEKPAAKKAAAVTAGKKKLANKTAAKSANKAAKKSAVKKTRQAVKKPSVRSSKKAKRKSKK